MIHGLGTTIACACLAGGIGVGLFFVKHEVKEQEARLAELNREIQSGQESIHVLKAEWSYLNDPARLRALSEKYLSMKVMGPAQVASLDSLPLTGPVFAAHAAPAPVVAHAAPVPAPAPHIPAQAGPAPVVAKAEPAKPAAAPAKAAPVKLAQGKPTPSKPLPTKSAVAKPAPIPVPAKPPVAVAAAPRPVLYPGADTTPRGAATAPRAVVVQSPALASTPALPGEVR